MCHRKKLKNNKLNAHLETKHQNPHQKSPAEKTNTYIRPWELITVCVC
jgi:hypothetical protein